MAENIISIDTILKNTDTLKNRQNVALSHIRTTCLDCEYSDACRSDPQLTKDKKSVRTTGNLADQPKVCSILKFYTAGLGDEAKEALELFEDLPSEEMKRKLGELDADLIDAEALDEEKERRKGPRRSGDK